MRAIQTGFGDSMLAHVGDMLAPRGFELAPRWLKIALCWLSPIKPKKAPNDLPGPRWSQNGSKLVPTGYALASWSCFHELILQFPCPVPVPFSVKSPFPLPVPFSPSNTPFPFQFPFPLPVSPSPSTFPFPFQEPFPLLVPLSPSSSPFPFQFLSRSPSSFPSSLKLQGSSWGCMLTHVGSCWGYVGLRWPQAQAARNGA